MSRGLICVFLFSSLCAVAFGELRIIKGPANFKNESSCIAQNGNKYYTGWLKNSETEQQEGVIYSLNFTSGKVERVFPDLNQRARKLMVTEEANFKGFTTEFSGSPVLICAGNKLLLEMTLEKSYPAGFTREYRTHIIFDLDLDISPPETQSQTEVSNRGIYQYLRSKSQ